MLMYMYIILQNDVCVLYMHMCSSKGHFKTNISYVALSFVERLSSSQCVLCKNYTVHVHTNIHVKNNDLGP